MNFLQKSKYMFEKNGRIVFLYIVKNKKLCNASKQQKCKIVFASVELGCNLDFVVYFKRFICRSYLATTINKLNDN